MVCITVFFMEYFVCITVAFMKYFSQIIRQMRSSAVYILLDRNRFSRYALIFPTNQSKRAA